MTIRRIKGLFCCGLLLLATSSCSQPTAAPTTSATQPPAPPNAKPKTKPAEPPPDATVETITFGEVAVSLSWSRTAAVFHAVDSMSAWSPHSHTHYAAWAPSPAFERTSEGAALMEKHVAMRQRLGRERGLEQIFYLATSSPRKAADAAKRAGIFTPAEAEDEAVLLETWSKRLEPHLSSDKVADDLRTQIRKEAPAFEQLSKRWLAIADLSPPSQPIPLVIVPSPPRPVGGGGANGGVIVIEVPEATTTTTAARSTLTTVGHELVHALVRPKWDHIERAAAKCAKPGVDAVVLSEAITTAMAPGLFAYDAGKEISLPKVATALKPSVAKALARADAGERGMLDDLLAEACKSAP